MKLLVVVFVTLLGEIYATAALNSNDPSTNALDRDSKSGGDGVGICQKEAFNLCENVGDMTNVRCNAVWAHINATEPHLNDLVHNLFQNNFQYLLYSAYYGNYQKNRIGFHKMFRKLSDTAWNDGIDMIKYMSKRGLKAKLTSVPSTNYMKPIHTSELKALADALDFQTKLAEQVNTIAKHDHKDRELSDHLEHEVLHSLRDSIRELSGHFNDLKQLSIAAPQQTEPNSLHLYLFDEHLQKLY